MRSNVWRQYNGFFKENGIFLMKIGFMNQDCDKKVRNVLIVNVDSLPRKKKR
jgi:hypothetical protein